MSRTLRFAPGGWFGVIGERATVLLPPSEKARVAGIWGLVDDGAGFDETLDALISGGLRDLPGFACISEAFGLTQVVVRGAANVVLTGAEGLVEVAGSTATTWSGCPRRHGLRRGGRGRRRLGGGLRRLRARAPVATHPR